MHIVDSLKSTPHSPLTNSSLTFSGLGVHVTCNHISHYKLVRLLNKMLTFSLTLVKRKKLSFHTFSQSQTLTFYHLFDLTNFDLSIINPHSFFWKLIWIYDRSKFDILKSIFWLFTTLTIFIIYEFLNMNSHSYFLYLNIKFCF